MGDMWAEMRARDAQIEKYLKAARFEPIPHPYGEIERKKKWGSENMERKPLKAYRVIVNGQEIGSIHQGYEASHRKAGRIITSTTYALRWCHRPALPSAREHMFYHPSRARATTAMVERMLSEGCTIKGGKLVAPKQKAGGTA